MLQFIVLDSAEEKQILEDFKSIVVGPGIRAHSYILRLSFDLIPRIQSPAV